MIKKLLYFITALCAVFTMNAQTTLFDGSTDTSVVFSDGFVQGPAYSTDATTGIVADDGSGSNNVITINRTTTTPMAWHLVGINNASHTPLTGYAITAGSEYIILSLRTTKNTNGNLEFQLTNAGVSLTMPYIGNGDGAGGFGPWQTVLFDFTAHIGSAFNTRIDLFFDGLDVYGQDEKFEIDNIIQGDNTLSSSNDLEFERVKVFPNPTNGEINISSLRDFKTITVHNMIGQEVKRFDSASSSIDISDLNTGLYLLRTDNGFVQKIMKN